MFSLLSSEIDIVKLLCLLLSGGMDDGSYMCVVLSQVRDSVKLQFLQHSTCVC